MARPRTIVCLWLLGLALACSIAGCGTPGKTLKMVNNTAVTVTMKSCPADASQAQQCSGISTIAPKGSADFPLSIPTGSPAELVVITGYGSKPRCFLMPPSEIPKDFLADVTDAQTDECTGA
jgi:hypothetical protein